MLTYAYARVTQHTGYNIWIKKKAYKKIRPSEVMHCYVERYKIIATPMNSNKFTEFDMKK